MENVGVVICGRRRFTVFPPDQLPNLYVGPIEFTPAGTPISLVDIANPDLDRFPRYAEAARHAQVAELDEGDAIYLPFHWWHAVDSLARVNAFVNYWWNDATPGLGNPYDALMHGLFALRGLPEEQRAVWRMVFDQFVFAANGDPVAHLPRMRRACSARPAAKSSAGCARRSGRYWRSSSSAPAPPPRLARSPSGAAFAGRRRHRASRA
ncbi:MAG: cupin-like domain-containing protein [Sphingomonas sp.]